MKEYPAIMKAINEELERKDLLISAYSKDVDRLQKENEKLKEENKQLKEKIDDLTF